VNAYQLVMVILMLWLASLGEIHGYQRIYRIGLTVFTVASLGCALTDSLLTLTAARIVQGVGAAGVLSVNTALVRSGWHRLMLSRGIGISAPVVAVSTALDIVWRMLICGLGFGLFQTPNNRAIITSLRPNPAVAPAACSVTFCGNLGYMPRQYRRGQTSINCEV
jgi:MFS family permease